MSKFVINKGMSNEFIITIKKTGSMLAMEISDTDTFEAKLLLAKDGSVVATIPVSVEDAINGKVKLEISATIVDTLLVERGDKADNYYAKPLYRLAIDCDTENNGKFVAKLDKVYVE